MKILQNLINTQNKYLFLSFVIGTLVTTSCKKLVTVDPPLTSITNASVYTTDANAISVLTNLYASLSSYGSASGYGISLYGGLSSDELNLYNASSPVYSAYYRNDLSSSSAGYEFWNIVYPQVYVTNEAVSGLTASTSLTPAIKQQLLGEAKFMRAFYYFYLTNLYGDVPLIITTDYKKNALAIRASQADVYKQIITDLSDAQNLLSINYTDGSLMTISQERLRPNKLTATALLARVYLYNGDWARAETQASAVLSNTSLYGMSSLANAFLRVSLGNKEAIWQLQPVVQVGKATSDAGLFIPPVGGGLRTDEPYLSTSLINSFETNDLRKSNWINSVSTAGITYYYPYKYKNNTIGSAASVNEYVSVFRLAEVYLIRAEAEANGVGAGLNGAVSDLNIIRVRAGLPNYSGTVDKASLLNAILRERQVELFSEWGHRWLDLKRTGLVNTIMPGVTAQKGGTWATTKAFYPLPLNDIQTDPNLTQNPGY